VESVVASQRSGEGSDLPIDISNPVATITLVIAAALAVYAGMIFVIVRLYRRCCKQSTQVHIGAQGRKDDKTSPKTPPRSPRSPRTPRTPRSPRSPRASLGLTIPLADADADTLEGIAVQLSPKALGHAWLADNEERTASEASEETVVTQGGGGGGTSRRDGKLPLGIPLGLPPHHALASGLALSDDMLYDTHGETSAA